MKLYLYAAAALALLGLAWYEIGVHKKAARVEAAEARVLEVEREKVALAKTFADSVERDVKIAGEIASFRAEQAVNANEFRGLLGQKPLVREVHREINGKTVTVRERDPHRYRCLHNLAVAGIPDSDCVF